MFTWYTYLETCFVGIVPLDKDNYVRVMPSILVAGMSSQRRMVYLNFLMVRVYNIQKEQKIRLSFQTLEK
jgi:hypothetical protein